jgi:hypothetical protein
MVDMRKLATALRAQCLNEHEFCPFAAALLAMVDRCVKAQDEYFAAFDNGNLGWSRLQMFAAAEAQAVLRAAARAYIAAGGRLEITEVEND